MPDRGAVYIAYGEPARAEMLRSREALERVMPGLGAFVVGGVTLIDLARESRRAKVNLLELSPFDSTLYLDADTRPQLDMQTGFEILDDGWDIAIMPSANQSGECLWHIQSDEREATFEQLGYIPLQLQAGVFFVRKNQRTQALFETWRDEWTRYHDQDQAALLRALDRCQVKAWLLGYPWNGGAICQHLFGRCR